MKKWVGGFLITGLLMAGSVAASEGTVELRNTEGEPARCWMGSVLLKTFNYRLIVSCRDLTYPASDEDVFDYALWIIPVSGKDPERLGVLGVGKAEFDVRSKFSEAWVTKEGRQQGFNQKMGPIVMRGTVRPIGFLEVEPGVPTPTSVVFGEVTPLRPTGASEGQAPERVAAKGVQLGVTILRVLGVAFVLGIGAIVVVVLVSSLGSKKNVPPGL
ncbi:MAG: hypothetical protein G01um101416_238 [Microgenomates group bacterium Gr01-1014_16]|nr:MAG: hypothetical protein G01um101416_238 [Microgenomates group bacterium Gr01-1014_16]